MSYIRHRATSGRVRGGRRALGASTDVSDMGTGLQISGDPVIALIAQINRFAGKTVSSSSGGTYYGQKLAACGSQQFLKAPLPLASALTEQAATIAVLIVYWRYNCVPIDVYSPQKATWASNALGANVVSFVKQNIAELVTTIAQYGDSLGYDAADVGITQRDPRFTPSFPYGTVAIIGVLAVAAFAITRRKR